MKVGVPKEIREGERRVAMSPDVVKRFVKKGVDVVIEHHAGVGSSVSDEAFAATGAITARAIEHKTTDESLAVPRQGEWEA